MKKILNFLKILFGPFRFISSKRTATKIESFFLKYPFLLYLLSFIITMVLLFMIWILPQLLTEIHPV